MDTPQPSASATVPAPSSPFPRRAIPWVVPLCALMLLLVTAAVWAGVVWQG